LQAYIGSKNGGTFRQEIAQPVGGASRLVKSYRAASNGLNGSFVLSGSIHRKAASKEKEKTLQAMNFVKCSPVPLATEASMKVIRAIERYRYVNISSVTCEFVVDDRGQYWFTHCSSIEFSPKVVSAPRVRNQLRKIESNVSESVLKEPSRKTTVEQQHEKALTLLRTDSFPPVTETAKVVPRPIQCEGLFCTQTGMQTEKERAYKVRILEDYADYLKNMTQMEQKSRKPIGFVSILLAKLEMSLPIEEAQKTVKQHMSVKDCEKEVEVCGKCHVLYSLLDVRRSKILRKAREQARMQAKIAEEKEREKARAVAARQSAAANNANDENKLPPIDHKQHGQLDKSSKENERTRVTSSGNNNGTGNENRNPARSGTAEQTNDQEPRKEPRQRTQPREKDRRKGTEQQQRQQQQQQPPPKERGKVILAHQDTHSSKKEEVKYRSENTKTRTKDPYAPQKPRPRREQPQKERKNQRPRPASETKHHRQEREKEFRRTQEPGNRRSQSVDLKKHAEQRQKNLSHSQKLRSELKTRNHGWKTCALKSGEMEVPYHVLGQSRGYVESGISKVLLVFNDIFDTFENYIPHFQQLCDQLPHLRVALFNYPGQAHSLFPTNLQFDLGLGALTAQQVVEELKETGIMHPTSPISFCSFGMGTAVASYLLLLEGGESEDKDKDTLQAERVHGNAHHAAAAVRPTTRNAKTRQGAVSSSFSVPVASFIAVNGFVVFQPSLKLVMHDWSYALEFSQMAKHDFFPYFFSHLYLSDTFIAEKCKGDVAIAAKKLYASGNAITVPGRLAILRGLIGISDDTWSALAHKWETSPIAQVLPVILINSEKTSLLAEDGQAPLVKGRAEIALTELGTLSYQQGGTCVIRAPCGYAVLTEAPNLLIDVLAVCVNTVHRPMSRV
jgi:hypothetical protein